ncbi:MAG: methyltransferase domain-containing protein [Alphaproteobacteria bacterium]|nr:methyltransferase domain-containing protein [Alphaproteobacteria bacterium]
MDVVNLDAEREVLKRYETASKAREEALCCPVEYDGKYLEVIPQEILDRDYGCGDPSRFVRKGETVLDLGSGGGKICYIISQITGPEGRVIGVDFNPAMLDLAQSHRQTVAERVGWDNVTFKRARIQDLHTDISALEARLGNQPVDSFAAYQELEDFRAASPPLIADNSIDLIVSNCVLNLVRTEDRVQLFHEVYRVLGPRGRVAISDIVSDKEVPAHMAQDPELWSGCISGAYEEGEFLRAFEDAGFHEVTIEKRDQEPWQTVEGIEFRAVTITAHKSKEGYLAAKTTETGGDCCSGNSSDSGKSDPQGPEKGGSCC